MDGAEPSKNNAKKLKEIPTEESVVGPTASTFGALVAENYSSEDVKIWSSREEADAEHNFKLGLGDAFFHGLNVLAQKNTLIKDQERALKNLKGEATIQQSKLLAAEKKAVDETRVRRDEVGKL